VEAVTVMEKFAFQQPPKYRQRRCILHPSTSSVFNKTLLDNFHQSTKNNILWHNLEFIPKLVATLRASSGIRYKFQVVSKNSILVFKLPT